MVQNSKPKTLNDFEKTWVACTNVSLLKSIKAEAMKWIDNERTLRMNANDFILVFFNITEADLNKKQDDLTMTGGKKDERRNNKNRT